MYYLLLILHYIFNEITIDPIYILRDINHIIINIDLHILCKKFNSIKFKQIEEIIREVYSNSRAGARRDRNPINSVLRRIVDHQNFSGVIVAEKGDSSVVVYTDYCVFQNAVFNFVEAHFEAANREVRVF